LEPLSRWITVRQFGRNGFIEREPEQVDLDSAEQGFAECKDAVTSEDYRLVILDEANVAVAFGLLPLDDVVDLIDGKPPGVELVITGRWAHRQLVERADLVTEMQEIKHYYRQGVLARVGVEK
jgi:cob(I)alamin adenosyltransferase